MKTIPLLITLALLGLGAASARADLAHELSDKAAMDYPAKNDLTHGDVFAQDLAQTFARNGIEAHVVSFNWSQVPHMAYNATFVVFKDSDGKYWGQQSTSVKAKWLNGTTPDEWSASFYPTAFTEVTNVSNPTTMATTRTYTTDSSVVSMYNNPRRNYDAKNF